MSFLTENQTKAIKIAFEKWNNVDGEIVERAINQVEKTFGTA
jgi:hypothetical protein